MTRSIFSFFLLISISILMTSCGDQDPIIIDSSLPDGVFTAERSGSLTAENGTPTSGTVELGTDESSVNFLRFSDDFMTQLATGTVSVYFSTSETFTADPGNGNPDLMLVGAVQENGERFFKLTAGVPSNFTHIILWCNTAGIPFGNAELN